MIVVADTSPLNYLIAIGYVHLLPVFFGHVLIPSAVLQELENAETPELARKWGGNPPSWIEIRAVQAVDPSLSFLDTGEREAITLAQELHADRVCSMRLMRVERRLVAIFG